LANRKVLRPVKKLGVGLLVVTIWLELCTFYSSTFIILQGSCTGLEFKTSLEKSLNFRNLKKSMNCFGKRVEGLE